MAEPTSDLAVAFDRPSGDGTTVLALRVRGEVDTSNAEILYSAVRSGLQELTRQEREEPVVELGAFVIDLREVAFIGATGLNTLITAAADAPGRREPVRLVVDHNRAVVRPAQLVGLDDLFTLYDGFDAAMTA